jgi:hypothetical protein
MPPVLQRRLLWYSLIGIGVVAPVFLLFYRPDGGLLDVTGHHIGRDFINVWTGPQIVDRFGVMTLSDLAAYHQAQSDVVGFPIHFHNWSYPLHLLFFAYPFSLLPYLPALFLWTVLGLTTYLAVTVSRLPEDHRWPALVFLLLAPATIVNIIGGQNGFFTAALVLGAIVLLDRRPWIAGVLVGLLTMKPHLGILVGVVLIATFAWRSIIAAAATTLFLAGASIVVWGIDPWVAYLTTASGYAFAVVTTFMGFQSYMTMSVLASARTFGLPLNVAESLQVIASIGAIAATAIAFRSTNDVSLRALLVTSGTFLVSPYSFNYDLPMLSAAILWVMASRQVSEREALVFGAAWILPAAVWALYTLRLGISPFIYGAVFVVALRMIWREHAAAVTAPATALEPRAA